MFKFKIKGQHLSVIEKPMAVSDTIKYLSASFEFSEDWDGLDDVVEALNILTEIVLGGDIDG